MGKWGTELREGQSGGDRNRGGGQGCGVMPGIGNRVVHGVSAGVFLGDLPW